MKKVIVYLNQFYGGIGGEDKADCEPFITEKKIGPAAALNSQLKGGEVTHTIVCGDNYMASYRDEALAAIGKMLEALDFDLLAAGPAFMAGRYGAACSEVCKYVQDRFHKTTVTSMYEENPGRELYQPDLYILKGGDRAVSMRADLTKMAAFANKLLAGEPVKWADAEGYFPRGLRQQVVLGESETASERAFEMMMKKLRGEPFTSEFPVVKQERIPIAAPLKDTSKATIAFISTGGIVPIDNPDKIQSASATRFGMYDISKLDVLKGGDLREPQPGQWRTVHGGYDPQYVNKNPMVGVPLDALHALEREGRIGHLYPYLFSTTGNHTNQKDSTRMAQDIIDCFKRDQVDAAILVSF